MSNSTFESSKKEKREFYAQPQIASAYDKLRFGGASGAWVDARELGTVMGLLPAFQSALDLGCGTGRLTHALAERGPAVGLDTSAAMLAQARAKSNSPFVQGDAFVLPVAAASFDAVTLLRVVFHVADLESLFSEIVRVLAPGGVVVFDTYLWSARSWRPFDPARWGGSVFVHSPEKIARVAKQFNLRIIDRRYCFLFSPYLYRRLPFWSVRLLARIEPRVPPQLRARVFWKLVRV